MRLGGKAVIQIICRQLAHPQRDLALVLHGFMKSRHVCEQRRLFQVDILFEKGMINIAVSGRTIIIEDAVQIIVLRFMIDLMA